MDLHWSHGYDREAAMKHALLGSLSVIHPFKIAESDLADLDVLAIRDARV